VVVVVCNNRAVVADSTPVTAGNSRTDIHTPARWLGRTGGAQVEKVIEAEAGDAFGPPNEFGPEASPAEFDAATVAYGRP